MKEDFSQQRSHLPADTTVPALPLAAILQATAGRLDLSRIFAVVAEQLGHILTHDAMVVLLRSTEPGLGGVEDAERGEQAQELVIAFCDPPVLEAGRSCTLADLSFSPVLLANQPAIVPDFAATAHQHACDVYFLERLGRAGVIVPIASGTHVLGGLALVSRTAGLYSPDDALRLAPIAGLFAGALERQRLDEQVRAMAVMEERDRLAREIHDTLAHSLTGIIINLESLKPYGTHLSRTESEVLADTELLARGALEEARRSVLGLHPTPLQRQSLRDAVSAELAGLEKRTGVTTRFYAPGSERTLQPDVATALLRIAQEALHNIYKYAAARHVIVGLAFEAEAVALTVEDDGVGFVPAAPDTSSAPTTTAADPTAIADTNRKGGFGILSMAARARILGGELHVTSQPGHGTSVRATIPYSRPGIATAAVILPNAPPAAPTERSSEHSPASTETYPALPSDVSSDGRPIRILLVDDHPVVRQGIRRILEDQPDMEVVGEAEDGPAAVEQAALLHPDVVLLDLQLPGLSGVEVLRRVRAAHPDVEVLVLTMFDQDEEVFGSLKAGARGYMLKDAAPAAVAAAVRAASRGQASLAPALSTRVMDRFAVLAQREVDPDSLTEREHEILSYMGKGMTYKEIGAQLNITDRTVSYHVTNILRKLNVRSRAEAVAVAMERGLHIRL